MGTNGAVGARETPSVFPYHGFVTTGHFKLDDDDDAVYDATHPEHQIVVLFFSSNISLSSTKVLRFDRVSADFYTFYSCLPRFSFRHSLLVIACFRYQFLIMPQSFVVGFVIINSGGVI